jgi:hypothetical protein
MIENSTQGLTLLDADHDAEVLGTEHHSTALERWAPYEDGRARRVAAELSVAEDEAGNRWIEVLIDGDPVGGLSPDAAARHSRHIEAVLDRGGRPAANGLVRWGEYGPQLELRLPDPAAPVRAPLPPAAPPAERPHAAEWPREPRDRRVPLLIGAGVLALLLVVGLVIGTRSGERTTPAAARTVPTTSALPTTTAAPTPTPEPTPSAAPVRTRVETTTRPPRTTPRRTRPPAPAPIVTPPPVAPPVIPPPTTTTVAPPVTQPPVTQPPVIPPQPEPLQCPAGQTSTVVNGVAVCAAVTGGT